ncbi:unnamed protein product [Acanthoscelides obtectus]|uniref:Uncharacterized protein n=1 Tax=Acanthoscelides obtectus TaxID=200917 RepID=A0A9P0KCX4_ACAOB|nr:unnamed protein product [Acanthoscelides obtectus]CAK1656394.1 hypothetical protein AOBTE_LOCUS19685 [Acanthoscelides obtectus]
MIKSVKSVKNKEMGYLKASKGFGYLPPPVQVQNAAEPLSWMIHLQTKAVEALLNVYFVRYIHLIHDVIKNKKDGDHGKEPR